MWYRLVGVVEAVEGCLDHSKSWTVWIFNGAFEQGLEADTDAHKGLAGLDVREDGGQVPGRGQLGQAVAKVADTREDQLL